MISLNVPVMVLMLFGIVMAIISWWKQKQYEKEYVETKKTNIKYSGWIIIFYASVALIVVCIIAQLMSWCVEYL